MARVEFEWQVRYVVLLDSGEERVFTEQVKAGGVAELEAVLAGGHGVEVERVAVVFAELLVDGEVWVS